MDARCGQSTSAVASTAPQPNAILGELKFFLKCVSTAHPVAGDLADQLLKCSLHLLQELPSSRDLVLEFFAMRFDASVAAHMKFIEKEPNGTSPEDETIADIQDALENLVTGGPHAWAPLISTWALRLLGNLSNKFSRGRQMDIGSACSLWLASSAMRCLLGLTASCFGKLSSSETEDCIAMLLSTYVQNSPHFDWVVARLGGCFPLKVISKILQCGLKGFVGNCNSTLDSEVGILGYLSFAHEADLKFAFREMLGAVLQQTPTTVSLNTIPYLMHLSNMSEILLQPIVKVFFELFNISLIPTLVAHSQQWSIVRIQPMLASLALKLKSNATQTVFTVTRIAQSHPWLQDLLETVIQELEALVLKNISCALLQDLQRPESAELLCISCRSSLAIEQQTAVRLLLIAGRTAPHLYQHAVGELLRREYATPSDGGACDPGLAALIRLLSTPLGCTEPQHLHTAIELALADVLLHTDRSTAEQRRSDANVLGNLVRLVQLERRPGAAAVEYLQPQHVGKTLTLAVGRLLQIWAGHLQREMHRVEQWNGGRAKREKDGDGMGAKRMRMAGGAVLRMEMDVGLRGAEAEEEQRLRAAEPIHSLATLLDVLELGGPESRLKFPELVKLTQLVCRYHFYSLIERDPIIRFKATHRVCRMLSRLCTIRKLSRSVALRELLEGAIFLYSNLFGAQPIVEAPPEAAADYGLLAKLNQKPTPVAVAPSPVATSNPDTAAMQDLYLSALTACCKSDEATRTIDGFATISLLLVELVSTDVMYNGLPWPDEEQLNKVTVERDLQIRRTFRNAPVLWSILGLVATSRPAICYASVLLRGLCASTLYQWRSSAAILQRPYAADDELFVFTQQFLQIMSMSQLLPAPLNVLHSVVGLLEPVEIAIVLKECVWNYMREHVPAPVMFAADAAGVHWRDPAAAVVPAHYLDTLRNIMQRNLPELGCWYHQMFVLPVLDAAGEVFGEGGEEEEEEEEDQVEVKKEVKVEVKEVHNEEKIVKVEEKAEVVMEVDAGVADVVVVEDDDDDDVMEVVEVIE